MSKDELFGKRGNPEFAGRYCQHEASRTGGTCTAFARYEVINPNTREAYISCGAHLAEYIRMTWIRSDMAAVVKEIPGTWRTHV